MKNRWINSTICLSIVLIIALLGTWFGSAAVLKAETGDTAVPQTAPSSPGTGEESSPGIGEDDMHGRYKTAQERLASMKKIAEDGGRELYYDDKYAEIAVVDTATQKVWFSNPYDYNLDVKASDDVKNLLASIVRLTYYDKASKELTMSSYKDCVAKEKPQFTSEPIENGIRINMQLGRVEAAMLLPSAAQAEGFEKKVLGKLDEKQARKINAYYTKISLSDTSLSDAVKNGYVKNYPGLKNEDFYILRNVSDREKRTIEEIIKTTDYTMEDCEEDLTLSGYVNEDENAALFSLSVEFTLDHGDLVVNIPAESIVYDKEEYSLAKILVCEFLGAGKSEKEGYLFIPDGSGTLINYNKYLEKKVLYTTNNVYGEDYSLTNQWAYNSLKQEIHFPVFGNKEEDKALFGIIEDGDAMADIVSESGNIISSYETVYPEFNYATTYTVNYRDETKIRGLYTYHDKNYYEGNYKIRYHFLTGDSATYSGMAASYRDYLSEKGILKKLTEEEKNTPLYLETLGTIKKKDTFLGFAYDKSIALTTFREAEEILSELKADGIDNLNLRYKGWMNGGMNYSVPKDIKLEKKLGGRKDLNNLWDYTKENGMGFFPEADFYIVRQTGLFDGYSKNQDSPRTISRGTAYIVSPEEVTTLSELQYMFYAVSPNSYNKYFNSFFKDFNKLKLGDLSVGNAGTMLYSDYKKSSSTTRQEAMNIVTDNLKKHTGGLQRLMTDGGNAYTLQYVTDLVKVPLTDSSATLSDESIPFMQLVLHGYLNYAGSALNLSVDTKDTMLKSIEYGSNLYYSVVYDNAEELKETPYAYYYSVDYGTWKQPILDSYKEFNQVYRNLQDKAMIDHKELETGVYQTTYEGGTRILVNYNDNAVTVGNVTVEPKNFVKVEG